jgi:DNA cross-link repair 1C protein
LKPANYHKSLDNEHAANITQLRNMLTTAQESSGSTLSLSDMGFNSTNMELSLRNMAAIIAESLSNKERRQQDVPVSPEILDTEGEVSRQLPRTITFPYSRHSSLHELQELVRIFKPRDVYPCTVDEDKWHESSSS